MKMRPEGELLFESYPAEHGYSEAAHEPDLGVPARRVLAYSATSAGSPRIAWRLMAEPALWHRWAPHIRGASGLGEPEIEAGRSGFVLFTPRLPVPARITGKRAERWWDWRVGPVDARHIVEARAEGCRVRVELRAAAAIELALRVSYGPLVGLMVRNLARVAAEAPAGFCPGDSHGACS